VNRRRALPLPLSRAVVAVAHDGLAAAIAWGGAFLLRFNLELQPEHRADLVATLPWVVVAQSAVFLAFGLYRGIWRYSGLTDVKRIIIGVGVACLAAPVALKMVNLLQVVPRSVLVLDPILLLMMIAGSRIAFRIYKEGGIGSLLRTSGSPVLVIGAGDAGERLTRELSRSSDWRVVGMLDDNVRKHGRSLDGVKVLGGIDSVLSAVDRTGATHAIIAMPAASHQARRRALDACRSAGLEALTVPSFDDLVSGRVTISQVRHVELDDLLGRDPVVLDTAGLNQLLGNATAVVTGAGGSIGSELARQIAAFRPKRLVLVDHSEFALYRLEQEFLERFPGIETVWCIADAKNASRIQGILDAHRPELVFHAAAYKHVPMMEDDNAWEAVQNNTIGTLTVARAAIASGVARFVLISTDKAVNPTNVMGASKRLAEMVCQHLQEHARTQFIIVRFGNVLGSTGSVIPKFREQIAKGGPVTVTHPEITRYFMSIPEAAQLVLQAALMGSQGQIFVMDMGEPVRIADLARDLIRLSGYTEGDIRIAYTGLRPGEKLYEELLADSETTSATSHAQLRVANARPVDPDVFAEVVAWAAQPGFPAADAVRQALVRFIPEYVPAAGRTTPR
jgi:FlaA1/EpsC-like NDP-sugar epimerase